MVLIVKENDGSKSIMFINSTITHVDCIKLLHKHCASVYYSLLYYKSKLTLSRNGKGLIEPLKFHHDHFIFNNYDILNLTLCVGSINNYYNYIILDKFLPCQKSIK